MKVEIKKLFLLSFSIINLFILTGCFKKNKKNEKNITNAESIEIETYKNENSKKSLKKSIFSDDEDEEEEIEIIKEESSNLKIFEPKNISKEYDLNEISEKKYILGDPILFEFNVRDSFKKDEKENFDSIIKEIENLLLKNKNIKLLIVGHACNSEGTERYNMQLSDDRATTIKNFIMDIFPSLKNSISSYGKGTTELLVLKGNRREQAKNRRVEIFAIEQ